MNETMPYCSHPCGVEGVGKRNNCYHHTRPPSINDNKLEMNSIICRWYLSKLQTATVQTLAKRIVLSTKAENAHAQSGRSQSLTTTDTKVIGMFHTPVKVINWKIQKHEHLDNVAVNWCGAHECGKNCDKLPLL